MDARQLSFSECVECGLSSKTLDVDQPRRIQRNRSPGYALGKKVGRIMEKVNFIRGDPLSMVPSNTPLVTINVVTYEHGAGAPARCMAGFLPAIQLYNALSNRGIMTTVRIIAPSKIARHCNGWDLDGNDRVVRKATDMLAAANVEHFVAAPAGMDLVQPALESVAHLLKNAPDAIGECVQKLRASGLRHGGEQGEQNALLYAAAHPYSWQDLYDSRIWPDRPLGGGVRLNVMSRAERRFQPIRHYLAVIQSEQTVSGPSGDFFTELCDTPGYIPLPGEPLIETLEQEGPARCHDIYRNLKTNGGGAEKETYRRAHRDFRVLMNYLGIADGMGEDAPAD